MDRSAALAAATALAALDRGFAHAAACETPPAGVQLWTVRDALSDDPRRTVAALRALGVVEAEMFGLAGGSDARPHGLPASELKKLFDDHGLRVPFAQIGGELTNVSATAELAHELEISTAITSLPSELDGMRDGRFTRTPAQGRAQLDRLAERLNAAGREYRALGVAFGYHNHDIELTPFDGIVPFDYLLQQTDAAVVKLELDVGWMAAAGVDPVAYLRRYAGRVLACHMKDYDPGIQTEIPDRKLVEPGAGTIDFAAVLAAMRETSVAHAFIEVDYSDDPLGAVERGLRHLREVCA